MNAPTPLMSRDLSRRGFLRGVGAAGAGLALASCARGSGGSGPTEIVFFQSKPEVIGYFDDLIEQFHQTQSRVRVRHDAASNLAGTFVRESPPDIGCLNYNFEISRYVERGALSDLSDMPEAGAPSRRAASTRTDANSIALDAFPHRPRPSNGPPTSIPGVSAGIR